MSGAGLPRDTSSPAMLISNWKPPPASVRSSRSRTDEEATATGMPFAPQLGEGLDGVVERLQLLS